MIDFLSLRPLPSIVNGKPLTTSKTYNVIRKDVEYSLQETLYSVACVGVEEVKAAVDSCEMALSSWKRTTVEKRKQIFTKAVSLLQHRADRYAAMTLEETCVPRSFSQFEISHLALSHLQGVCESLEAALKTETVQKNSQEDIEMRIKREPFGVVLGIAPGNAPFVLALRACLYAIAAGNTCVLKTSENSPRVGLCVGQLLLDAGLPTGVLSVVHVDPTDAGIVTEALISHPSIRKINFTGSTRVGRIIAVHAARYLKPCVLELGGKAPNIVLDDADLLLAANNVLFGGNVNSSQVCMAVANIFVQRSVKDEFEDILTKMVKDNQEIFTAKREQQQQQDISGAAQYKHALRGLFSSQSGANVKRLYTDAREKGAKVVAGTPFFDGELVQPCVLGDVDDSMAIFHEEVFGPVLSMITFDTIDEVVEQANRTEYGLAAGIFGRDQERTLQIADRIDAGQVHINGQSIHDHGLMPHGGWKSSGYGRFNGVQGIQEFTQTKGITIQTGSMLPFDHM